MEESQARELGLCDDCAEKVSALSVEKWWVSLLKLPLILVGKLVRLVGFLAFSLVAFLSTSFIVVIISYSLTQSHIKEIVGSDKQVLYTHEDRETAEILNYLTGRCSKPRGWSSGTMPIQCSYSEERYKMIWAIEKVSGGPRVRFINPNNSPNNQRVAAHYFASPNIMYIHPPQSYTDDVAISDFTAEASHAIQYHENPARFMFMAYKDISLVLMRTLVDTAKSFGGIYIKHKNEMYHLEGTVENEAHEIIGPRLRKYVRNP